MKSKLLFTILLTAIITGACTALITINVNRKDLSEYAHYVDILQDSLSAIRLQILSDSCDQYSVNVDNIPNRVKEKIYYASNGHKWRDVYSYDEHGRIKNIKCYEQDTWKFSGNGWGLIYEYKYSYNDKSATVKMEDWSQMVLTSSTTTYILE